MKKGKIKIILEDHWHGFLKIYENKIRSNVKKEVEKILKCKDTKYIIDEELKIFDNLKLKMKYANE